MQFRSTKYIRSKTRNQINCVINMLQNWNHRYYSHNSNIKCAGSTIKYISLKLIPYVINFDVVSSFMIFSNFDCMFLSLYYWFESMKLFFSSKKRVFSLQNIVLKKVSI